MKTILLFALLVCSLVLNTPASAQEPTPLQSKAYQWGLVVDFGLHVADIELTRDCINRGTCREANVLYAWANDKPGWLGATKGLVAGAAHMAVHRLLWKRGKHWQAITANVIIGVGTGLVVRRNSTF